MKGIIIFLLSVIVCIMGYNQYQKYQRFHPQNVHYVSQEPLDNSYHNQKVVMDYYEAVEVLKGYIISQWSANRIDVRNPKKDNAATNFAVNEYQKKLGQVKYYEAILQQSASYKLKGLSNKEIIALEKNQLTPQAFAEYKRKKEFRDLFEKTLSKKTLGIGDRGPWVYELQKYLTAEGYTIAIDGDFNVETQGALKDFEQKNQLYPDGELDVLTLNNLLKSSESITKPLLAIQ